MKWFSLPRPKTLIARNTLTVSVIFLCLMVYFLSFSFLAFGQEAPYPPSTLIGNLTFDFGSISSHGAGSDQWPMTWADDGEIYGVWGDGYGWSESGTKMYMGVTRIQGDPPQLSGIDVWGGNGTNRKPSGIIADGNQKMYLFWGTSNDGWKGSYGGMSSDNGTNWNFGFPQVFNWDDDGVQVVGIAQFGPGYTNIPSEVDPNYFYVYLSGRWDGGRDGLGVDVYLGKVSKADIFNREAYNYFNGLDSGNNPIWSSSWSSKTPIFTDPAGMAYHVNVSYNPGISRFIYAKGQNTSDVGIFEGPTPWGPWGTVYYGSFIDNHWKFTFQFPQKLMSSDGLTMEMAWSGWPEYDNVNFIKTTLTLNESGDTDPPATPTGFSIHP